MHKIGSLPLMETLGDRVKAEREAQGLTQADLAKLVVRSGARSMSQVGIHKIETKGDSEPKTIRPLAKALGLTVDWLQTGKGEKYALRRLATISGTVIASEVSKRDGRPPTDANVVINELSVNVAAGVGGDADSVIMANEEAGAIVGSFAFPRASFREMVGSNPDGVRFIAVRGDSMMPTLWPGQRVMVDLNDKTPSPPGLFVVWDGLSLVLKRIELIPDSDPMRVRITSDNGRYSSYERTIEEAHINGRVIGVWAKL